MAERTRAEQIEKVLVEFVQDVNDSGGVTMGDKGFVVPVADLEWVDLGETYLHACKALSLRPKVRSWRRAGSTVCGE